MRRHAMFRQLLEGSGWLKLAGRLQPRSIEDTLVALRSQQPGATHTALAPLIRQLFFFAAAARIVCHVPKAAEELRQPLLLAMCLGFRLDCLQAPLVRSALRATIGPRPDAATRALTAGLFFSRSFFNRLDWHSHSQPPRFASPIVALKSSRSNPVLLRTRRSNVLRS
jgi:hypothetical protein